MHALAESPRDQLVMIADGERVTTTPIIAANTENEHRSVVRLVREYLADFEEFGRVRFEIAPFETAGGEQKREIAYLNEDQAALLMTYMRNSAIVRAFKKRLIHAFREISDRLAAPALPNFADPVAAARAWADAKEAEQKALALIEQQRPAVEFVERYVEASGSKGFREVCKLLKVNEKEFRQFLLDRGIMYRLSGRLVPYSQHMDAGRFEIKAGVGDNEHAYSQTRFTTKGIAWVSSLWFEQQAKAAA